MADILSVIEKMRQENTELIIKNSVKERVESTELGKAKAKLENWDNPRFKQIKQLFEVMDKPEYWGGAIEAIDERLKGLTIEDQGYRRLCKLFCAEFDRKETIYNSYKKIVENPLNMDSELKRLKNVLKEFDRSIEALGGIQLSIFEQKG